jgi:hypothetical protein
MAWFTLLNSAVVAICTFVAYIARITYNHRRKIDDLRKQGMVSQYLQLSKDGMT